MRPLLDGQLDPITSEFGFVQADSDAVAEWILRRESAIQAKKGGTASRRHVSGDLPTVLGALLPLTSVERRRVIVMPTLSKWTAVFDNGWRGGDAAGLSPAALGLHCQAIRIAVVPEVKMRGVCRRYGGRIFELYGPEKTEFLNYVRTICVVNDGGRWRMDQSGALLPGEDPSWYAERQVKGRFREEHLDSLLKSLGIEAFEQSFYGSEAALIERHGSVAVGCKEYGLLEVQAQWR